jgi:hypothetical protein
MRKSVSSSTQCSIPYYASETGSCIAEATHDLSKDTLTKCRSEQSQERTAGKIAIVQISSAKAPKDKERDEANSKAMDHEN